MSCLPCHAGQSANTLTINQLDDTGEGCGGGV